MNAKAIAPKPVLTPLEGAVATHRDLSVKHAEALARRAALAAERDAIAFRAHTGDTAAGAALADLNREESALVGTIAGLSAAVAEAERRVRAEEAATARAAQAERQLEVERLRSHMRSLAEKADAKLAEFISTCQHIDRTAIELNAMGEPRPSIATVRIGLKNSLAAQLTGSFLSIDHQPPSARRTIRELAGTWFGPEPAATAKDAA